MIAQSAELLPSELLELVCFDNVPEIVNELLNLFLLEFLTVVHVDDRLKHFGQVLNKLSAVVLIKDRHQSRLKFFEFLIVQVDDNQFERLNIKVVRQISENFSIKLKLLLLLGLGLIVPVKLKLLRHVIAGGKLKLLLVIKLVGFVRWGDDLGQL